MSSFSLRKRSVFFRFFPPPKTLLMPHVGVDISDRSVRFFELLDYHGEFSVGKYGTKTLSHGVIEEGEIKNRGAILEVLQSIRKESGAIAARVSIPEEKSYLFSMTVPRLSEEETRENIAFSLEEHVPVGAVESVFDFSFADGKKAGAERKVIVAVSSIAAMEEYSSVFNEAGLLPLSFELKSSATARALIPAGDVKSYMIVDIGSEHTVVSIVHEGVVAFSTSLEMGGDFLTYTIQKELAVSPEEAERLKRESGLLKEGSQREVFGAVLKGVSSLADEINKYFIYWRMQEEKGEIGGAIEKIILCGGGANLPGLADHLALSLKLNVCLADVWANIFDTSIEIPPLSFDESLPYGTAIGLAVRRE